MNGHAQGSQWRTEFVRHGGDQIVLELVEAEHTRDVLKHEGGAGDAATFPVDRRGAREVDALAGGRGDAEGVLEALGTVGAVAAENVGTQTVEQGTNGGIHVLQSGTATFLGIDAQYFAGGLVRALQGAGGIEHEHRIGEAVDRGLRCLLRLQQLTERASPVALQVIGHGIELLREPGNVVFALHARTCLQIPLAKAAHGRRDHPERAQQARGETDRGQEPEHRCHQHRDRQEALEPRGP